MDKASFDQGYTACYMAHNLGGRLTEKQINILQIAAEVKEEVLRATALHSPMHSPHEADSVIREEYEEFWDEVKRFNLPKGRDSRPQMREELIQLAAMAVRAISDVIDLPQGGKYGNLKQVSIPDAT